MSASSAPRQEAALFRAIYWGPARAAFRVLGPSYLLLVIIAGFVFGGQGLHPRTLVEAMLHTGWGLALGYGAWWLFSGRGYRAAFNDPAVGWLRTLPLSRAAWTGALLPWVVAIESPWLALWAIGAPDWRSLLVALSVGVGVIGHSQRARHRAGRRQRTRVPWLELSRAWVRTLWRRFTLAFVVLAAGWTLTTAVCLVMGERNVEATAVRVEFIATALALVTLVSAASLRWLLHDELRRLSWLLGTSPTHVGQTVAAEVIATAAPSGVALVTSLTVLAWRLPALGWALASTAGPSTCVAVLAAVAVPVFARGRNPSRAPLRVVLLLAPYLFVATWTAAPFVHASVLVLGAAAAVVWRAHVGEGHAISQRSYS